MHITNVHAAIQFKQMAYIKPYADYHTSKRAAATSTLIKNMHKLMMNSLFGKTMEDVRKHKKTQFVKNKKLFLKYAFHPLCKSYFRINNDAMVMNLVNSEVELSKPIYIGQCVLDFSKVVMYKLFDAWKENTLCDNVQLIGGDTDSFFMEIESSYDRDTILKSMSHIFDSSNYPPSHPLYSEVNKARLGCFKDEAAGEEIEEFICLSPKSYSYKMVTKIETVD